MRENIHAIHGNYTYEDPQWDEIDYEKEFGFQSNYHHSVPKRFKIATKNLFMLRN